MPILSSLKRPMSSSFSVRLYFFQTVFLEMNVRSDGGDDCVAFWRKNESSGFQKNRPWMKSSCDLNCDSCVWCHFSILKKVRQNIVSLKGIFFYTRANIFPYFMTSHVCRKKITCFNYTELLIWNILFVDFLYYISETIDPINTYYVSK